MLKAFEQWTQQDPRVFGVQIDRDRDVVDVTSFGQEDRQLVPMGHTRYSVAMEVSELDWMSNQSAFREALVAQIAREFDSVPATIERVEVESWTTHASLRVTVTGVEATWTEVVALSTGRRVVELSNAERLTDLLRDDGWLFPQPSQTAAIGPGAVGAVGTDEQPKWRGLRVELGLDEAS